MPRNFLTLPSTLEEDSVVNLADWVELTALLSADRNASKEDLKRAIQRETSVTDETAEAKADAVFSELSDRAVSCGNFTSERTRYPFETDDTLSLLSLKENGVTKSNIVYLFMLLLSKADLSSTVRRQQQHDPTKIFENLCCQVLSEFWGGKTEHAGAMVFGTASHGQGRSFVEKIKILSSKIGEGGGPNPGLRPPRGGDGGLDLVAWRKFADNRTGGLIGFAQCKTGTNWEDGLTSLNPNKFLQKYLKLQVIVPTIRLYMIPHRISSRKWEDNTHDAGILLDRCRIVQYSTTLNQQQLTTSKGWLLEVLAGQSQIAKDLRT